MNWKYIAVVVGAGLTLSGCSLLAKKEEVEIITTTPQQTVTNEQVESSGDVEKDLIDIDETLDSMDVEKDFPTYTQSDLEQ